MSTVPQLETDVSEDRNKVQITAAPRCFKVLLGGAETADGKLFDRLGYRDEGLFMQWEAFGADKTGIYLNDYYLSPENVIADNDGRRYLFEQKLGSDFLRGWCEFVGSEGVGHVTLGESGYVLRLEPWAPRFDMSIATGESAGAYWVADKGRFEWKPDSAAWKHAAWQPKQAVFGYQVTSTRDPISGETIQEVEILFEDANGSTWEPRANEFDLVTSSAGLIVITAENPPEQPERAGSAIKSVFPARAQFQLDRFGFGFDGVYSDTKNRIYAVQAEAQAPMAGAYEMEDGSRLSLYGGKVLSEGQTPRSAFLQGNQLFLEPTPTENSPSLFLELNHDGNVIRRDGVAGRRVQGTLVSPHFDGVPAGADTGDLSVKGLLGMNPMARDGNGGWYDTVGRFAMDDFYRILVNYMDPALRQEFIAATPPDLSPEVRHVANDDSAAAAFYKDLQVPYLAKALSLSTQSSAKFLNGQRATKKLKRGCADSAVYTRHADKLYRLHWMKRWPHMEDYLRDQREVNLDAKKEKIRDIMDAIYKQLDSKMKKLVDDPDAKKRWLALVAELDALKRWGQDQKLYWAAQLYYHLLTYWLPKLELMLKDGHLSQEVTQDIKNISSVFSILEGSGKNPNGPTFQIAFMDTVRAFQLGTVIPQYIDYAGDPDYFLQVLESVFSEFVKKHAGSLDPDIQKHIREIQEFRTNRGLTMTFLNSMQLNVRLLGPSAAWSKIVTTFQAECTRMVGVSNALMKAQVFSAAMGVAGFAMVMSKGDFDTLSPQEKAAFITLSAGAFASVLFAIARGIVRVSAMWKDIQGFVSGIKVFFGGQPGKEMINVSSRLSSNFAKWFARSREESMALQQAGELGTFSKMFGRNLGELTAQVFGAALAIVTIVLCAIELANTTDPLNLWMNSLMIASAGLQLIAIVGGWAMAGFGVASAGMAAILSVCGALAIAAAIAGIVIMIILMTRSQDPPDPIRDFANGRAAAAGLQMPHQIEVDYFDIVPAKDGVSYDGVAFQAGGKYLKLALNKAGLGTLTHEPDTLFFIDTDGDGSSAIFTRLVEGDRTVTVFLTADSSGNITAAKAPTPPTPDDKGVLSPEAVRTYEQQVKQQRWKCRCAGQVSQYQDKEGDRHLMSAAFTVESAGHPGKYLTPSGDGLKLQTSADQWKLSMEQIGPGKLAYYPNPYVVSVETRDSSAIPSFSNCGSAPRTWTVAPALPSEFELVKDGPDEGKIRQKAGVPPKAAAEQTFNVTVSNVIQGHTYSSQAQIKLEVRNALQWSQAFAALASGA
ncbi:MAG TPA: hypothetical protein VMW27_14735 [Thermoanaerobaculia bacterium]|nr:hypothetical protein [Thermoanaerobaculia bacterium]